MRKKIVFLICGTVVNCIVLLCLVRLMTMQSSSVLFFNALFLCLVCAFITIVFIRKFYETNFEKLLVLVAIFFFNVFLVYFAPITADRSLTSFIYFYSVENSQIPADIYNEDYFKLFVKRRIDDAQKMRYLTCDNKICYPTWKTYVTYLSVYPLAYVTNTLVKYHEFKAMMNGRK